jgi:hypothetical protein
MFSSFMFFDPAQITKAKLPLSSGANPEKVGVN